jgi:hypothetical protein
MYRILILDRASFCPLFDLSVGWKADQRSAASAAPLIQFFFQFAKDINGGSVRRVEFENSPFLQFSGEEESSAPAGSSSSSSSSASSELLVKRGRGVRPNFPLTSRNPNRRRSFLSSTSGASFSSSHSPSVAFRSLELFCCDNSSIIACLFLRPDFSPSLDRSAVLVGLRDSFTSRYSSLLSSLSGEFSQLSKHVDESMINESYLDKFRDFQQIVLDLNLGNSANMKTVREKQSESENEKDRQSKQIELSEIQLQMGQSPSQGMQIQLEGASISGRTALGSVPESPQRATEGQLDLKLDYQ